MSLDVEHLQQPFEKVIKSVGKPGKLNDPERVHKLRTNTRRVEAILGALRLETRQGKRLLKDLKGMRKAAGRVRDMDVLTGKAANVNVVDDRNCQIRLLLHLGAERQKEVATLESHLRNHGKRIRQSLRQCAEKIDWVLHASPEQQLEAEAQAAARGLQLSAELQKFPRLTRGNLHQFRIAGKQLRYVLQIAKPQNEPLLEGLRAVQDAIGEWHDWEELLGIARDVLEHGRNCGMLRELRLQADSAFDEAMRGAHAFRKRFLSGGDRRGLRVVEASAKLAA